VHAEEALQWGLATTIVPHAALRAAALELAHTIATKKSGSLRHTKRLLWLGRETIALQLAAELEHFVTHSKSAEAKQGWVDFVAQRHQRSGSVQR
jgi:enoyl-CoA hydratase/carnithine racemase